MFEWYSLVSRKRNMLTFPRPTSRHAEIGNNGFSETRSSILARLVNAIGVRIGWGRRWESRLADWEAGIRGDHGRVSLWQIDRGHCSLDGIYFLSRIATMMLVESKSRDHRGKRTEPRVETNALRAPFLGWLSDLHTGYPLRCDNARRGSCAPVFA